MDLILVADPMCSWCYGFGKEMALLQQRHPDVSIDIVLGGLRAGATDVLNDEGKQFRLHHWAKVEEASGLSFNREGLLAREGFVYDTEPVCRAVVTARILRPEATSLNVFRALQHAFYVDALDTTAGSVLAEVASRQLTADGHSVTAAEFLNVWNQKTTIDAAAGDFAKARSLGVTSFPTLFLNQGGSLTRVGSGYAHVDQLEQQLSLLAAS